MNRSTWPRRRSVLPLCLLGCLILNFLAIYLLNWWQGSPAAPQPLIHHDAAPGASVRKPQPLQPVLAEPAQEPVTRPPRPNEKKDPVYHLVGRAKEAAKPVDVREGFDGTTAGLPKGWSGWTNQRAHLFGVSDRKALSPPHSLAITGNSTLLARAWLGDALPADIQAGAAVYLGSLIPAEVFIRGTDLKSGRPTYYAATVSRGLEVQLVKVVRGSTTVLAKLKSAGYISEKWVRLTIQARGRQLRVQVLRPDTSQYLDGAGQWVREAAWALGREDKAIGGGGCVGVGRSSRYNGSLHFDDFMAAPPGKDDGVAKAGGAAVAIPALPRPQIPRHYPHIRIAMLAYYGNPMGAFKNQLLRESVDLVVPHPAYLKHIKEVAPGTPQLIYTNTSNLYLELLMGWLTFADAGGIAREAAFYHAARPVAFRGSSPSSRPVTWFWGVYRGAEDGLENLTSVAQNRGKIAWSRKDESLCLGYPDRFREINVELDAGADTGWSAVLEYAREVDKAGSPAKWAPLAVKDDTTGALTRSGRITFDPPADWKTASLQEHGAPLLRSLSGHERGHPSDCQNHPGPGLCVARGGTSGTVPAFDFKADANGDGYLDDREYARRAKGKDARFAYESRMLTESYGQMRYAACPASAGFRAWAVDHHLHALKEQPLAAGFFMDNSDGKAPVNADDVVEPVGTYAQDYGAMLNAIARAVAPRWVLANTALHPRADPVVQWNPAYMEEFAIRPLAHHYVYFEDLAATVSRRAQLVAPAPLAVIDSHPQRGTLTDPRMQIATLACYYLIADPETTFLMFYGGFEPASTWRRHWAPAAARDIGPPAGKWSQWATGADPGNARLSYRVYRRDFKNAVVLYKPLSYARGVSATASLGAETTTQHDLGGSFQPLQADGTLSEPTTKIKLRNGEGAILIKK